jgi:alanine-glyoxylate transaminase/serine-glyoxylate transaminase/serine-pyruvate transaminase
LVEPGDRALVVNTGFFSDRFASILERYGAQVTHASAPAVGDAPSLESVAAALRAHSYKLVALTHVDTSTAVGISTLPDFAALARQADALLLVDGVCSVAGEELRMDDWGGELALTASQKAIGVPPGLALVMAGPRAMEAFQRRRSPVGSYYSDWSNWLPIMQAYEARRPSYFGTPPVNLIWALNTSLVQILEEGLDARFARHRRLSHAFKAAVHALGLEQVPVRADVSASTLTALFYPDGISASLLSGISAAGVIVAGGLHPQIKDRYFRVGHMGAVTPSDILTTVGAIEHGLDRVGYRFELGAGLAEAQRALLA